MIVAETGPEGVVVESPRRPRIALEVRRDTALVIAAVAVVGAALGPWLGHRATGAGVTADLAWDLSWLAYAVVGALVAYRRPDLGIGLVLVTCGAVVEIADVITALADGMVRDHASAGPWVAWVAEAVFGYYFLAVGVLLPSYLPDGRVTGRDARRLLLGGLVVWTIWIAAGVVQPGPLNTAAVDNPLGWSRGESLTRAVIDVSAVLLAVVATLAYGRLLLLWRRAAAVRRQSLALLALGGVVTMGLFGIAVTAQSLGMSTPGWFAPFVVVPLVASAPVAVGLAVLRTGLLDIELVLRRTLTYVAMTVVVLVIYALTVLLLGREASRVAGLSASLLVTALAAVGLSPLRERAQRQVDRLLYGRRADPYGVLRLLDAAIGRARTSTEVLPAVTGTIATALRLPYVAVATASGAVVASGEPQPVVATLPLHHHGREVGTLRLAARSTGERFSALDDRLLAEVAGHVGSAVAAVELADEAQRSREQLVRALEDDRRRIRRDLHDHLGPVLSGITLQLDALRRISGKNAEAAELAGTIRGEVADAVVDVRRLVHGLRPPVLDEIGLVEAVRLHAAQMAEGLPVTVSADDLPALPAAVEVAAYRIVTEALTNTLRHAGATRAEVRLAHAADRLVVDVADDGTGIADDAEPGVGLRSMRERVAELGGVLDVRRSAPGTLVHAELPA